MPGQGGALSATANPALPRHPEPEGRTARARCGRRNTATPAAALRSAQALRAHRRYRRPPEGVPGGRLRSSLFSGSDTILNEATLTADVRPARIDAAGVCTRH